MATFQVKGRVAEVAVLEAKKTGKPYRVAISVEESGQMFPVSVSAENRLFEKFVQFGKRAKDGEGMLDGATAVEASGRIVVDKEWGNRHEAVELKPIPLAEYYNELAKQHANGAAKPVGAGRS